MSVSWVGPVLQWLFDLQSSLGAREPGIEKMPFPGSGTPGTRTAALCWAAGLSPTDMN